MLTVKKVVACKLSEEGHRVYKVKWESTWEPEERLQSYGNLLDKFWGIVFTAKEAVESDPSEILGNGASRKRAVLHSNSCGEGPARKKKSSSDSMGVPRQAGAPLDDSLQSTSSSSPARNSAAGHIGSPREDYAFKQEPDDENALSFASDEKLDDNNDNAQHTSTGSHERPMQSGWRARESRIEKSPLRVHGCHQCPLCEGKFSSPGLLNEHIKTHNDSSWGASLRWHDEFTGVADEDSVERCGKPTQASTSASRKDEAFSPGFGCQICGRSFTWRNNLYRHLKNTHGGIKCADVANSSAVGSSSDTDANVEGVQSSPAVAGHGPAIGNKVTPFARGSECPVCHRHFNWKNNMYRHLKGVHGTHSLVDNEKLDFLKVESVDLSCADVSYSASGSVEKKYAPAACPICNKAFTIKHNMHRHMRSAHNLEPHQQRHASMLPVHAFEPRTDKPLYADSHAPVQTSGHATSSTDRPTDPVGSWTEAEVVREGSESHTKGEFQDSDLKLQTSVTGIHELENGILVFIEEV